MGSCLSRYAAVSENSELYGTQNGGDVGGENATCADTTPSTPPEPSPEPTLKPRREGSASSPSTPPEERRRFDRLGRSDISTKWVSRSWGSSEQGTVFVNPDSTFVTDAYPSSMNLVTLFGPTRTVKPCTPARTGGMVGRSPAVVPCTSGGGVDLSRVLFSLEAFTGTASGDQTTSMSGIGFVEVDWLGDRDPSHSATLAIPPMLLSKITIFKLKDVSRRTAFDTLAVLQSAAEAVNPAEREAVYGHLIIVVYDTVEKADDIKQLIFGIEEPSVDASDDDVEALELRNSTRRNVKIVFEDVIVRCLPPSHSNNNENKQTALADLTSELDGLGRYMGGVLKTPHTFGGCNVVGGVTLQPLMTALCNAVSMGRAVEPSSIMNSVEREVADWLSGSGAELFEDMLGGFDAADVWMVEAMEEKLGEARDTILAEFDLATKNIQEAVVQAAKKGLERWVDGLAKAFRTTMEIDRGELDSVVRRLNEKGFAQFERKVSGIQLPVDYPEAVWSTLCDRAFENYEDVVTIKVGTESLLKHVPAVLSRVAFETAVQDKFHSFELRNVLDKLVKRHKMDRAKVDYALQKITVGEVEENKAKKRERDDQDTEHSKNLKKLQDTLVEIQKGVLRGGDSSNQQRRQQKEHQKQQNLLQHERQRAWAEADYILLDRRLHFLAIKEMQRLARKIGRNRLPVDDPAAVWSDICDSAFAGLLKALADEVHHDEKHLLRQMISVLSREEFQTIAQDIYECFEQCNSLEEEVKHYKITRTEADTTQQLLFARIQEEALVWSRRRETETNSHSKKVKELEANYFKMKIKGLRMEDSFNRRRQQQQDQYARWYRRPTPDASASSFGGKRIKPSWDEFRRTHRGKYDRTGMTRPYELKNSTST